MADRITFKETLNTSVQVGDDLWYSDIITGTATSPVLLGTIISKGDKWVKVDSILGTGGQVYPNLIINGGFTSTYTEILSNGDCSSLAVLNLRCCSS